MEITKVAGELVQEVKSVFTDLIREGTALDAHSDLRVLLKRDHDLVRGMLEDLLEHADRFSPEAMDLAKNVINEITLHAKSEERVLYRACEEQNKDFRDFALEGFEEHALVESVMKKLAVAKPGPDGHFKALVTVLKELIEHHAGEEERDLFPKLALQFSEAQLVKMGDALEIAKRHLTTELH